MNLFLDIKHTPKIQKYINLNWKKDHILAKNNKLFFWQHGFKKNKIDFIDLKKTLILNWMLNKKKIIVKLNRRKKIIF